MTSRATTTVSYKTKCQKYDKNSNTYTEFIFPLFSVHT